MSTIANLRYLSIKDIDFYMSNIESVVPSMETLEEKMIVQFLGNETVDFEKKIYSIALTVVFLYGDANPPTLLLKYTSESAFLISNFEDIIIRKPAEEKFHILPNIHLTLMGVTLSTVRGILRERLAATALNNIILPLIGSDALAKDLGISLADPGNENYKK